jgi:CRP-like cAMP-binding protein
MCSSVTSDSESVLAGCATRKWCRVDDKRFTNDGHLQGVPQLANWRTIHCICLTTAAGTTVPAMPQRNMFHTTQNPVHNFLRTQTWFKTLPHEQQEGITAQVFTLSATRGKTMLQANERPQGWYGVLNGLVRISAPATAERRSDFLGVAAGEWFGEGAVLKNEVRGYEVVALRDSELLCLPGTVFHQLQASSLAFNQCLVTGLNLRVSQAMAIIHAGRTRSPEQRIALSLSRLFWSRTRLLDLTQDELASLAGMSRQTANRVLNVLQERGVISLSMNRIKILDDAALTQLLNS